MQIFWLMKTYSYLCIVKRKQKVYTLKLIDMSTQKKNQLKEIMLLAWQFVKKNGFTMGEALKCAWANMKLKARMADGIVKFHFQKVDGTVRQAFGTLKEGLIGEVKGTGRKPNDNLQVYWDTEKEEYRCFKKCNLIKIA